MLQRYYTVPFPPTLEADEDVLRQLPVWDEKMMLEASSCPTWTCDEQVSCTACVQSVPSV